MLIVLNNSMEVEYFELPNGKRFKLVGACPDDCADCCESNHPLPGHDAPCPLLKDKKCTWQENKPLGCIIYPVHSDDLMKCPEGSWSLEWLKS